MAETVKTTPVFAVIKACIDADFGCSAASISALYGFGALVLVPVGNFLTRAPLRVPVKLKYGHDGACVLLKSGKRLVFRDGGERRKNAFAHGVCMCWCAWLC